MQPQQTSPVIQPKQNKPWYKKWWVITIFVLVGLSLISTATSDTQTTPAVNVPVESSAPKYEINIVGNTYADPTSRRLTFTVKNIGDKPSTPSCNITLENEARTYNGSDYVIWDKPLNPGEQGYYEELVIITNEGAAYATKSNVRCVEKTY